MIRTCNDFATSEPGRWVARAMFRLDPDSFDSDEIWSTYTMTAHDARDSFPGDDEGSYNWVQHIRRRFGVWSSGEKALALAVLHAIDYDWLADELATFWSDRAQQHESRAISILSRASGDFAEAVGACFARVDR